MRRAEGRISESVSGWACVWRVCFFRGDEDQIFPLLLWISKEKLHSRSNYHQDGSGHNRRVDFGGLCSIEHFQRLGSKSCVRKQKRGPERDFVSLAPVEVWEVSGWLRWEERQRTILGWKENRRLIGRGQESLCRAWTLCLSCKPFVLKRKYLQTLK